MKHEKMLCLGLGSIPNISHYIYPNISTFKKTINLKYFWFQAVQIKDSLIRIWTSDLLANQLGDFKKLYNLSEDPFSCL